MIALIKSLGFFKAYSKDTIIIRFLKSYKKDVKTNQATGDQYIHWRAIKPQNKTLQEISIYENKKLTKDDIWFLIINFFKYYLSQHPCDCYGQERIEEINKRLKESNLNGVVDCSPHPFPHYLHGNIILKTENLEDDKKQLLYQIIGKTFKVCKV